MATDDTGTPVPSGIGRRRSTARSESNEYYRERRKMMIEAAAALFKEKGFKDTTLDDIARAIGTDRASLYYYVSSKKEIFFEIVHGAVEQNLLMAEEILAGNGTPAQKLQSLVVNMMDSYARDYPNIQIFLQENLGELDSSRMPQSQSLIDLHERFEGIFKKVIQQGMDDGSFRSDMSPTMIAYAVLGMVNWTHRWFEPTGPLSGAEIGTIFSKLIFEGALKPA